MNNLTILAIDIAKNVFQLHGNDNRGNCLLKKRLSRSTLCSYISNLVPCTIVMEACGGSNYWARKFRDMGHQVKLISPQYVKPFVKTNKNDANDAEAIAEAASRPSMNYVSPKNIEQQDLQSVHRIREGLILSRTALCNQIRGLLLEYGISIAKSVSKLKNTLPLIIEDFKNDLSDLTRQLFKRLYSQLNYLNEEVKFYDSQIENISKQNSLCNEMMKIDGIGPISATAILSSVANPNDFKNGRHFAAWLGLVPRQFSSGGKIKLGRISKRGDKYIRKLLIHGARSAISRSKNKFDSKSIWALRKVKEIGYNKACVALANKHARIIWNLIAKDESYCVQ